MFTRITLSAVVVAAATFTSCTKDPEIINGIITQPSQKQSLTKCSCSADSIEYIRGTFNGVSMCFNTTYSTPDSSENINYYTPGIQDQINLIRQNTDASMSCQLYFTNSNIYHQQLPYLVPRTNLAYCEHVELHLLDYSQRWASQCQGCSTDNADYFGDTWNNNFSVTITDTTGGFLKGTFEGTAATGTGVDMKVENGAFRIFTYRQINMPE